MAPKDNFADGGGPDGRKARKSRKQDHRLRVLDRLPRGGTCVEVGVWRGEFSQTILDEMAPERLILVDAWADPETEEKSESLAARGAGELDDIYGNVCRRFAREIASGQVEVVRAWSQDFIPTLTDDSVDFAYIDADHSYEGLSRDLELILPKLKIGGIVMCDDYHRRGWWKDGVIRAVNEFLGRHAAEFRVRAMSGAQIAFERLEPMG